ncbi:MAG: PhnD/SsuA/transferrin family substrate-binding protein [Gammaproteobacteria bacterium]|jgi:ABC-type phosphate/phosphonate transport system substrate-binding protein|nr:PhnD/SsuA/transferrin family substrate-binding protein [Gammaproteobacteria bacterium]
MKTSITLPGLLLGLILSVSAWAQDEAQDQSGASGERAADTAQQSAAQQDQAGTDTADDAAQDAAEAQGQTGGDADAQTTESAQPAEPTPDDASEATTPPAQAETQSQAPETAETFVFQGHPIFSPRTAELAYRPLVDYLNASLPYRFDLELSPDYHRYWLSTRRGRNPHLVLEEPHLTAYRMEEFDYTPIVRADEPISYSLLTSMDNAESSVRDFVGQRVSTMPAPSLGYLILASWFDNPMQQPIIQSNAASWRDAVEIVFSQEADAAIVPNNFVSRYVNMANVLTSQEFPGVTVSASPEVPADIQREIRDALLALHEDEEHFAALNELDINQFIEADAAEYEGLEEWLSLVYSIL